MKSCKYCKYDDLESLDEPCCTCVRTDGMKCFEEKAKPNLHKAEGEIRNAKPLLYESPVEKSE